MLSCLSLWALSQEKLELFIADEEFSLEGKNVIAANDGYTYLLVWSYDQYSGNRRIRIIKLDQEGNEIWMTNFPNNVSSDVFYQATNGDLILPYQCHYPYPNPNPSSTVSNFCITNNTQKRVYRINAENGAIIGDHTYDESKCAAEMVIDFVEKDDTFILSYRNKEGEDSFVLIEQLSKELEELSIDTFHVKNYTLYHEVGNNTVTSMSSGNITHLSKSSDKIYMADVNYLYECDLKGKIRREIKKDFLDFVPFRMADNEDYLLVLHRGDGRSILQIIDKGSFTVVGREMFQNEHILKAALLNNNEILIASIFLTNNEEGIKVSILDSNLNALREKMYRLGPFDLGGIHVKGLDISTDEKFFYLVGSNAIYEGDIWSHAEVYFLKDQISNLDLVYREMEGSEELGANIYPNPTDGKVNILLDPALEYPVDIKLFATDGKLLKEVIAREDSLEIDLSALPIGIYYLILTSNDELYRKEKLLKMW